MILKLLMLTVTLLIRLGEELQRRKLERQKRRWRKQRLLAAATAATLTATSCANNPAIVARLDMRSGPQLSFGLDITPTPTNPPCSCPACQHTLEVNTRSLPK